MSRDLSKSQAVQCVSFSLWELGMRMNDSTKSMLPSIARARLEFARPGDRLGSAQQPAADFLEAHCGAAECILQCRVGEYEIRHHHLPFHCCAPAATNSARCCHFPRLEYIVPNR